MNNRKRITLVIIALLVVAIMGTIINNQEKTKVPEKIVIALPNNKTISEIEPELKTIKTGIDTQLDTNVEFVEVTKEITIQGLKDGKIDAAFLLPTDAYKVNNEQIATPYLQEVRKNSNLITGEYTDQNTTSYQSLIATNSNSNINSIKDLKGKKICAPKSTSSISQYINPTLAFDDEGMNLEKDATLIKGGFADELIIKMQDGLCDAALIYQDIRTDMLTEFPNIFEETKVFTYGYETPNNIFVISNKLTPEVSKEIAGGVKNEMDVSVTKEAWWNAYKIVNFKSINEEIFNQLELNMERFNKITGLN